MISIVRGRPGASATVAAMAAAAMVSVTGCVGAEEAAPLPPVDGGTVALGALPDQPSAMTLPTLPATSDPPSSAPSSTVAAAPVSVPLADGAGGTAVLLVGDTALAATTSRATDSMCEALVGAGWDVGVEAEPGRPVEFGDAVFDAVIDVSPATGRSWDVVGLMFGHHLSDAMVDDLGESVVDRFAEALGSLVDRIGDRPVVLYTVVETESEQVGIDDAIREIAAARPNVVLVDWAAAVAAEPELVVDGGPLPSDDGAERLASLTADVLGIVVDDADGDCIESTFVDDSAIVL
jgi:hypothetical protein